VACTCPARTCPAHLPAFPPSQSFRITKKKKKKSSRQLSPNLHLSKQKPRGSRPRTHERPAGQRCTRRRKKGFHSILECRSAGQRLPFWEPVGDHQPEQLSLELTVWNPRVEGEQRSRPVPSQVGVEGFWTRAIDQTSQPSVQAHQKFFGRPLPPVYREAFVSRAPNTRCLDFISRARKKLTQVISCRSEK
jgi:hypothetical protein